MYSMIFLLFGLNPVLLRAVITESIYKVIFYRIHVKSFHHFKIEILLIGSAAFITLDFVNM